MPQITLAEKAGFCFGVDRAIKLIEKLVAEGKKVATLGPIIHNQQVIEDLENRGVGVVENVAKYKEPIIIFEIDVLNTGVKESSWKEGIKPNTPRKNKRIEIGTKISATLAIDVIPFLHIR